MASDANPTGERIPGERSAGSAARKSAHAFRGALLDHYGRLEQAIVPVLVAASRRPEYREVAGKLPLLFGQKIELLRKLASGDGPLKGSLRQIPALLDRLAPFDEVRHLMSHGTVVIAQTDQDMTLYLFRMLKPVKDHTEQVVLVITPSEANILIQRVGSLVDAIVKALEPLTKTHQGNIVTLPAAIPLSA